MKYVHKSCKKLYGLNGLEECKRKKNFCTMCCDNYIGKNFSNKLNECKIQCKNLVFGRNSKAKKKKKK